MSQPNRAEEDPSPESLREGDSAAWEALYRRWDAPLRAYLYRLSGDMHEADELAAETFVRAWKARHAIRGGRLSTWLFSIATNLRRNRLRWWRRRLMRIVGMDEDMPEVSDNGPTPADSALSDERAARVRDAVLALPAGLREPLVLAVYEEKSQAEIAEILGCTVKAAERRIARARDALRVTLAGEA